MTKESNILDDGILRIDEWRNDWCKFAREALGVNLDAEQEKILHSVQVNPRTSVASGTEYRDWETDRKSVV